MDPTCAAERTVGGVVDAVGGLVGSAAAQASGSVLTALLDTMASLLVTALGRAFAALGTAWMVVPTPQLATGDGWAPSPPVALIQSSLAPYVAGMAVLSVAIAGARMAWEQRAQPARELLKGLLTLVVANGAGLAVIALATSAADAFAIWILLRSTEGRDLGAAFLSLVVVGTWTGGNLVMILLGFVALLASVAQVILMVIRGGMLVLLAGTIPLAASLESTETGRAWFRRVVSWTIAFILYKPVAAMVYATAFSLAGSGAGSTDDLLRTITGLAFMLIALVALPALMRFVSPLVAATTGSSGGAAAFGLGILTALPMGSIALPGSSSAGGSGPAGAPVTGGPGGGPMAQSGASGPSGGGPGPTGGTANAGRPGPTGEGSGGGAGVGGSTPATGAPGVGGTVGGSDATGAGTLSDTAPAASPAEAAAGPAATSRSVGEVATGVGASGGASGGGASGVASGGAAGGAASGAAGAGAGAAGGAAGIGAAGIGAAGGGAAGGAAAAGAAAGPVGVVAGVAGDAAVTALSRIAAQAQQAASTATADTAGDGGPDGSA